MRLLAATLAVITGMLAAPVMAAAAPGDLDPSFGNGGLTILDDPFDTEELLEDVLVLPDGRILAGGFRGQSEGFLLARLDVNGAPDTSYGDGGISVIPFSGGDGQVRAIHALDTLPDGRIVAAGLAFSGGTDAFAIARYTADGSALDPAFNGGEPLVLRPGNTSSSAVDVVAAPGAKVVAIGNSITGGGQIEVVRRTATASPDVGFNFSGERAIAVPGSSSAEALSGDVFPDGSVLVAGEADQGLVLVKLADNGQPDGGFGTDGFATHNLGSGGTSPSGAPLDVRILPDGRILATGLSAGSGLNNDQLFVARFTAQGDLDQSFGTGGVAVRDPSTGDEAGYALDVLPDGRIVVAGSRGPNNVDRDGWLLRFTANGQPDPAFGSGGEVTINAGAPDDELFGLRLDSFGRAVAVGQANQGTRQLLVARFLGDPEEPPAQSVLDPDLRELELVGRRLTPFGVSCFAACAAQIDLRSRSRLRLPHGSTHRRAVVSIGSAALPGGTGGRRTVPLGASRRARAILKRRRIAASLRVSIEGGETLTRNVTVRAAQRTLKLNRRGRGSLRLTFQAEADRAQRATLTLRLGGSVAARKRFTSAPGRSKAVAVRLNTNALARLAPGGRRSMKLTLRYRTDTGAQVSQSRSLRVLRKR